MQAFSPTPTDLFNVEPRAMISNDERDVASTQGNAEW